MKKYVFLFLMIMMGYHASTLAQAVDDRAVVPIAVTLNSILRLNVKSGGNIEFNFNNLNQYEDGITNTPEYDTKISIASSVNWKLIMGAEDDALVNIDEVSASPSTMPLGFLAYSVEATGTTSETGYTIPASYNSGPTWLDLPALDGGNEEIITNNGGNAGGEGQNAFTIHWECGTDKSSEGSLLGSDLTGGRYATNVFFILEPAN
jgi:hypothetical protein